MSKYSPIEKLIIMLLTIGIFAIPAIFRGKKDAKKKEEEEQKRKEQYKKEQEEEERKFREDKNNIANTIDQSIYDKVDFTGNGKDTEKMVNWLNKYTLPKLLTPAYKKSIKDAINAEVNDGYLGDQYKNYLPYIHAEYFDDHIISFMNNGDKFEEQEIKEICLFVIIDIANIVRKAIGREVGTGDGDEGCIYF